MLDHSFIFSAKPRAKLARHIILWIVYAVYFTAQSYLPTGAVQEDIPHLIKVALVSTAVFLPWCAIALYVLLYFLYPRFLEKQRFALFGLFFLALFTLGTGINYIASRIFYYYTSPTPISTPQSFFLGVHNVVIGLIFSILLLGIHLGRKAYSQQQANLRLARQLARTELQLLKTRLDPQFLFRSLDDLRRQADAGSPAAPAAILRLSDTLSEVLYGPDEDPEDGPHPSSKAAPLSSKVAPPSTSGAGATSHSSPKDKRHDPL